MTFICSELKCFFQLLNIISIYTPDFSSYQLIVNRMSIIYLWPFINVRYDHSKAGFYGIMYKRTCLDFSVKKITVE